MSDHPNNREKSYRSDKNEIKTTNTTTKKMNDYKKSNQDDDDDDDINYIDTFVKMEPPKKVFTDSNIKKVNINYKDEDEDEDALLIGIDLESAVGNNKKQTTINFNEQKVPNQMKRPPSSDTIRLMGQQNKISTSPKMTNLNLNSKKIKYETKTNNKDEEDDDIECFFSSEIKEPNSIKNKNQEIKKPSNLIETVEALSKSSFIQSCCLLNNDNSKEDESFSTCIHKVKGVCKTLTKPLTQINLKWIQECKICDINSGSDQSMDVYIGNEAMNNLLGLTCDQAKQLHKQSRDKNDINREIKMKEWDKTFAQHKFNCEEKLKTQMFLMFLKYDLKKQKFCIFKMVDFGLRNLN
jgi:hypothetical protein